jgi:hypothetical protein
VIEKSFKLLESTKSKYEFRNYLNVLKYSQLLLTLSCFEREFSYIIEKKICVKSDIEEAFEEKVENFDKNSAFFGD